MIAMLAARPLRRLGSSLVRQEEGWWIRLAGGATKTGRPDEKPVPEAFTAPFGIYLARHRPVLLGAGDDDHLWLTLEGAPVRAHVAFEQVSALTGQRPGVAVNPHTFRHAVTTSVALDDPHRIDIAATVLGHGGGARTAQRHYNLARTLATARQRQAEVRRIRGRPEPRGRHDPEDGA
jgi:integrase